MLSLHNISLERHFEPVFEPVSVQLNAGSLLVLTGDNGSGKTTLLRIIAGLNRPTSGTIELAEQHTHFVGHGHGIKDDLSVVENLTFMARLAGIRCYDFRPVLETLSLTRVAEQSVRTLSAGQKKRCALARLLISPAALWLLDEPYSNLDEQGMRTIDRLLQGQLDSGGACIMATHGQRRPDGLSFQEFNIVSAAPEFI